MKSWQGIVVGVAVLALWLMCAPACNSNFIPVPPPSDPTFSPVQITDAMGGARQVWMVSGPASAAMKDARIYIFNNSLGVGVIGRGDRLGAYSTGPLEGNVGDQVELHYEMSDGERSPSSCRILAPGVGRMPCR